MSVSNNARSSPFLGGSTIKAFGLISFNSITGFKQEGFGKRAIIEYFDTKILIEFSKDSDNEFTLGNALFTNAGKQLCKICTPMKSNEILSKTLSYYEKNDDLKYGIVK